MNTHILWLALAALAAGAGYAADSAAPPRASTNAPAAARRGGSQVRSPEIAPDGRVTFRLRAPKAAEVVVNGQWPGGRAAMAKDESGLWSVTTGPVEAGVWEYSLSVDGVGMIDPGNTAIKPMREPRTSILHVPGAPPRLHDFQDVPHGAVTWHSYRSKAVGRVRELAVYTPPGYDGSGAARYPVLYLQHGSGDNQATWTVHGKAHWILDNLAAQGRVKPMVVVMMDGHAAVGGPGGGPQNNVSLFERDLLEEVLPFVEKTYRVKTDAASRAIAGLSMGGGQSLSIGLGHLDRFGWVAGFSSSAPGRDAISGLLAAPQKANDSLKLLWVACGKDDFLLKRNEEFIGMLKEAGIRHQWHLTEGAHSWPVWRLYLADLAPLLFQ